MDTVAQHYPPPLKPEEPAMRFDSGKLRYDLIPTGPLKALAEVYTRGAEKYAPENWRKGMSFSRMIGPLFRHLEAWRAGESHDPDTGCHHLAQVVWNAMCLIEFEQTHPELDDRVKWVLTVLEKEYRNT